MAFFTYLESDTIQRQVSLSVSVLTISLLIYFCIYESQIYWIFKLCLYFFFLLVSIVGFFFFLFFFLFVVNFVILSLNVPYIFFLIYTFISNINMKQGCTSKALIQNKCDVMKTCLSKIK